MNFEATLVTADLEAILVSLADQSASGQAAKAAIAAIVGSGAFEEGRLLHVHATTSERMVAVLVRVVEHPKDAR